MQFVTASHNEKVLKENLLASPVFNTVSLIVMRGYTNVPCAYNAAITGPGPVCYIHHDVYLPDSFMQDLNRSMDMLPSDWEIAGVAGVLKTFSTSQCGHIVGKQIRGYILDRGKLWGHSIDRPVKVDTIDEMLIITREPVKFDEQFAQDFYGADICMGRNTYVISAFCHHNSTRSFGGRTESFYESEQRFKKKHVGKLPVVTTCSIMTADV